VLQVGGHHRRGPGAQHDGTGGLQPGQVQRVEQRGADQHQVCPGGTQRDGQPQARLQVQPVRVQGADVHRVVAGRQVAGAGHRSTVGGQVDGIRHQADRPADPVTLAPGQGGGADHHRVAIGQQQVLVLPGASVLGRVAFGTQPVVGDVVQRAPAGGPQHRRAVRVVHPEHRVGHPQSARRPVHGPGAAVVGAGGQPSGQPLGRSVRPGATGGRAVMGGERAEASAEGERGATAQIVQVVDRRLDEEHVQRRVVVQQSGDQVLVAAPDLVPGFQAQHHQVLPDGGGHQAHRRTSA